MTKEQINTAIATWMGWEDIYEDAVGHLVGTNPEGFYSLVPYFQFDLNAIHCAEEKLSNDLTGRYEKELRRVQFHQTSAADSMVSILNIKHHALHATAAQRAEALLKTIGKWQPTTPSEER